MRDSRRESSASRNHHQHHQDQQICDRRSIIYQETMRPVLFSSSDKVRQEVGTCVPRESLSRMLAWMGGARRKMSEQCMLDGTAKQRAVVSPEAYSHQNSRRVRQQHNNSLDILNIQRLAANLPTEQKPRRVLSFGGGHNKQEDNSRGQASIIIVGGHRPQQVEDEHRQPEVSTASRDRELTTATRLADSNALLVTTPTSHHAHKISSAGLNRVSSTACNDDMGNKTIRRQKQESSTKQVLAEASLPHHKTLVNKACRPSRPPAAPHQHVHQRGLQELTCHTTARTSPTVNDYHDAFAHVLASGDASAGELALRLLR
eukprot:6904070-Pyramimonas_sp.AAC.1